MAIPIETHYQVAFSNQIALQSQQMESKLQATVMNEELDGEKKFFDDYDSVSMTERVIRSAANNYQEVTRNRRMITPRLFEYSELFDPMQDEVRIRRAVMPDSALSANIMAAIMRQKDSLIETSFDATAFGGKDGTTSIAYPAGNIVDSAVDLTTSGITIAKEFLDGGDVEESDRFAVYHPDQLQQLLVETTGQFVSRDFNIVQSLVRGEINQWVGFTWVSYTGIPLAASLRQVWFYHRSAVVYGQRGGAMVRTDEVVDRGHSWQVAAYLQASATRRFETRICSLDCNSS